MAPPILRTAPWLLLLSPLAAAATAATPDEPSLPPVLWYAPFLSGGGYCSEAIGFLQALESVGGGVPVRAEQHGDSINPGMNLGFVWVDANPVACRRVTLNEINHTPQHPRLHPRPDHGDARGGGVMPKC